MSSLFDPAIFLVACALWGGAAPWAKLPSHHRAHRGEAGRSGLSGPLRLTGQKAPAEIHLLNAKASETLGLNLAEDFGPALIEIQDITGRRIAIKREHLAAGPHAWKAPPSNLVITKPNK